MEIPIFSLCAASHDSKRINVITCACLLKRVLRRPLLLEEAQEMWVGLKGWSETDLRVLKAPMMVMLGDDDLIRPEHALAQF